MAWSAFRNMTSKIWQYKLQNFKESKKFKGPTNNALHMMVIWNIFGNTQAEKGRSTLGSDQEDITNKSCITTWKKMYNWNINLQTFLRSNK